MDSEAMTGTYHDYEVAAAEKQPLSHDELVAKSDQHDAMVNRLSSVVKDMIDSGNHYWANETLKALSGHS